MSCCTIFWICSCSFKGTRERDPTSTEYAGVWICNMQFDMCNFLFCLHSKKALPSTWNQSLLVKFAVDETFNRILLILSPLNNLFHSLSKVRDGFPSLQGRREKPSGPPADDWPSGLFISSRSSSSLFICLTHPDQPRKREKESVGSEEGRRKLEKPAPDCHLANRVENQTNWTLFGQARLPWGDKDI
jgi:hypothetical protein